LEKAKVLIENWGCEYNTVRPHSNIGNRPRVPQTKTLIPSFAFREGGYLD